jgi:hypothetical protein
MNFFSSLASKWSMTNTIGLFIQKPDIQRPVTIREAEKKFGHKPKRGVRWASILVPCIPRSKPEDEQPQRTPEVPAVAVNDGQIDGEAAAPEATQTQEPVTEKSIPVRRPVYFKAVRCVVDLGRETEGPNILESEGANAHVAAEVLAAAKQYATSEGIEVTPQSWSGRSSAGRAGLGEDGTKQISIADCLSVDKQLATFIHELAHVKLGHLGNKDVSHNTKEIQAEVTAYVVSNSFGIPADYSATYLRAFGADQQKVYDNLRVIGRVTKQIINGIERQLRLGVHVEQQPAEQEGRDASEEDIIDESALETSYRQAAITVWQKKNTDFSVPAAFDASAFTKVAEIIGSNLGHAFSVTQSVEGRWQKSGEEGLTVFDQKARSTSVGDVLELEGCFYAVTCEGFDRIEEVAARKSVRV